MQEARAMVTEKLASLNHDYEEVEEITIIAGITIKPGNKQSLQIPHPSFLTPSFLVHP